MRTVTGCFKYRLYPTADQQNTLVQWAGCRRFVWNWALHCKQTQYQATGQRLNYSQLATALVELKRQPKTAFLRECHSQPLQQVLMDLETAFSNFFAKRAKYPRFKTRKTTPHSLRFPQGVMVVNKRMISVPKIGLMRAVIHRPLLGTAKGATIKQDATGAWWVLFVCHIDRPDVLPTTDNPVGIDVGLESFTTLSTGEKTAPPKFYRRSQKKLSRPQRKLSRAQKGSNNRAKARKRVARIHNKINNQRADWRVIKVGRFYASSKTCHHCQTKTALTLAERVWTCHTCGTTHDRDVNAAINILHEGLCLLAVVPTGKLKRCWRRCKPSETLVTVIEGRSRAPHGRGSSPLTH